MNISYLREFIELGLSLNFSKTASALHISQSSLSKHVAALEQECDAPLLKRTTSRVQLTLPGQILFENAVKIINDYDNTLEQIHAAKNAHPINVGGIYKNAYCLSLVNQALSHINAESTVVSIQYQDYRHKSYVELLDSGRIDLAFTILDDSDDVEEGLQSAFLGKDPMVCLVKKQHPFAKQDKIHIQDLSDQTILQPVGSHSSEHGRSTVKNIFARYGIRPTERPTFVNSITELSTVENKDCVLIMEQSMLSTQPFTDDYQVLTFYEDDVTFSFYAVWRHQDDLPILDAFVDELVKAAKEED